MVIGDRLHSNRHWGNAACILGISPMPYRRRVSVLKKMMVGLALGYPKLVVSVVDEVDGDNVQGQHCPMNKFYKDLQT